MIAPASRASCSHANSRKNGKDPQGRQKFKCRDCGRQYIKKTQMLGGGRVDDDKALLALSMLLEGISIRAAQRLTAIHRDTIGRLIAVVGDRCKRFLAERIRDIEVKSLEADEIWAFVEAKQKTCDRLGKLDAGDFYTFTAIDPASKLLVAWHVGRRDDYNTDVFAEKVSRAIAGRFQLSTDGFNCYKNAIPNNLVGRCDYGIVVKVFGGPTVEEQRKYSPARVVEIKKSLYMGKPDMDTVSTSRAERHNLSIRMHVRRFTRLTNAHSKVVEQHEAMFAIFAAWYNLCRKHETLKGKTPAMAAGLTNRVWSLRDLLEKVSEVC